MKLFGNKHSACTRSVLMVLAEKCHPVSFEEVDLSKGEHKSEAHLLLNPFGKVPVLVDAELKLYESQAINRYLDAVLPGPSLTPAEPKACALMDQWLSIDSAYFLPQAYQVVLQKMFVPMMGGESDQAIIGAAEEKLRTVYQVMDATLAASPYLAGSELTLADLAFVQYTDFLLQCKCEHLVFSFEHVRGWWHRMSQRDSYKNPLSAIS